MRVVIGRIGRPHGIRGEVTIEPRTDEPERRFAPGNDVLDGERTLVIERSAWQGKRLVVKFRGVEDRDAAEALRDVLLEVDRAPGEVPEDPDEFFDTDLVGLDVLLTDGRGIGVVREILHLPGQDVIAIDSGGREVLVPFTREFVPDVDMNTRRITVDPPDGLLDI